MQQIDSVADLSPLLTTLLVHVDADGICVLTLNRPTRRNGFNLRMSDELVAFFAAADVDAAVKAIVLTGGAGDFFCAGADLDPTASDLSQADSARPVISAALSSQLDRSHTGRDLAGRVVLSMLACRKVCIAALNGTAVGVGITMALSADFRFVAEDAKIGFVFTRRGLAPEGCSTVLLPRLVGHTRASDWILTGRVFTAKEASDTGLFTKVLKRDQVLPEALACARSIIKECSPVMTTIARALLWQGLQNANLYQAHLIESKAVGYAFGSDDFAEGVASFFQKRAPQFPSNVNVAADLPSFYPWWTSLQVDHPFGGVRLGPKL